MHRSCAPCQWALESECLREASLRPHIPCHPERSEASAERSRRTCFSLTCIDLCAPCQWALESEMLAEHAILLPLQWNRSASENCCNRSSPLRSALPSSSKYRSTSIY